MSRGRVLWVGRCGSVACCVGRSLWVGHLLCRSVAVLVGCCESGFGGSVAVCWSPWIGCCGLLALYRLLRRLVTLCRALWVGYCVVRLLYCCGFAVIFGRCGLAASGRSKRVARFADRNQVVFPVFLLCKESNRCLDALR